MYLKFLELETNRYAQPSVVTRMEMIIEYITSLCCFSEV